MKKNMGNADRIIRVIIAAILSYLVYNQTLTGVLATISLIFSVVFVLTSLISFCPLYPLLGVNTCSKKE